MQNLSADQKSNSSMETGSENRSTQIGRQIQERIIKEVMVSQ